MAQQSLEYGRRRGHDKLRFTFPVAASEIFKKAGGAFVSSDANGRVAIATGTAINIVGHALLNENLTASSTAGATKVEVDMALESVYELPINTGTWADTMRGKTCDLSVSSSVQGVDVTASTYDVVQLIDKGTTNVAGTVVSVLVRIVAKNLTYTGVV